MSALPSNLIPPRTDSRLALAQLGRGLLGEPALSHGLAEVPAAGVPAPFDGLLVHNQHMTLVLEAAVGSPIHLHVAQHAVEGNFYRRKIRLTPDPAGQVLELGIVRLDLRCVSEPVREEILRRDAPLGRILIEHNVLRRVEPKWYFKFDADWPGLAEFGAPAAGPAYGRLGTIYCDERPAIELLEIIPQWTQKLP